MRKVDLRMKEQEKYQVIKKLVETNGNKKRASIKLNCSVRTINRLINKYNEQGKEGFIHGNRGKLPAITIPLDIKTKIVELYIDEYPDANFTHFCEIVEENIGVKISDTTLNKWLREENVISPKAHKKTRKQMKKLLKQKLEETSSTEVQNNLLETINTIDEADAHPRRPRSKYAGEMIQMDASSFCWIDGEIWHLHVAIDDATGMIVGAYFDHQETLKGYYSILYQILINHGIPAMFYTDRRTIFEYKRKNRPLDDEDTFTQFSYACHNLGIEIKTTSVPQAKGRVERLNQTLQSRLPVELRHAHITNIEEANEFLNSYIKKFNERFALHINNTLSVYEKQPTIEEINRTLAILSHRKIDGGHCFKFNNKYYIPINENGNNAYFAKGTECLVIETFDKQLLVNIADQLYLMKEVPQHKQHSKEFDCPVEKPKRNKKHYIPPMDHPWRRSNFTNYAAKQKHRIGANV